MTNLERIRQLEPEKLAEYLIKETTICDWADEFDEYVSPSGDQYIIYEDAIEDCVRWLNEDETGCSDYEYLV